MSESPEQPPAPPTNDVLLQGKMELLDLEMKKLKLQAENDKLDAANKKIQDDLKNPALKPWWQKLIDFLALPAAVLALAGGIITASNNIHTQKKTDAETAQINQNMAKPSEAGKIATDLAEKQKEGPKAYQQAVEQNAGQIQGALQRLQTIDERPDQQKIVKSLAKFILLWILFHVVDVVFGIITQIWGTTLGTLQVTLNTWRNSIDYDTPRHRRWRSLERLFNPAIMILAYLPNIIRWSIQLSIVVTLLAPLFDEVALESGSPVKFAEIMRDARHFQFAEMLAQMKHALFG